MPSMKLKIDFCARVVRIFLFVFCLVAGARSASAFALLGPFAPWMTQQLSYQDGISIGGPMNIGEGYRWNVPVITYGYDQSFLDFFGTNGVAAVESAIQVLNNLPPASQIDPTSYPLNSSRVNYAAQEQNLIDLKSYAMSMLLEQMGLAQPTRYIYCLHDFVLTNGTPNYTVLMRNFDPITWQPSTDVNGVGYFPQITLNWGYAIFGSDIIAFSTYFPIEPVIWVQDRTYIIDPSQQADDWDAVADNTPSQWYNEGTVNGGVQPGRFYLFGSLTQDDAGGLAYLLNSNTVAPESLLPGVQGAGTNASNFVNAALRPGVEKITFQRIDYISPSNHTFPAITNTYVDSYFTNGVLQQQTLQRVITQPDILFTAHYVPGMQVVSRSGTSNWMNNGYSGHDGPGVIQPPVQINFNQLGPSLYTYGTYPQSDPYVPFPLWASYDQTTNDPLVFPSLAATNGTVFHFELENIQNRVQPAFKDFCWPLSGEPGALYSLETSTNLQNWVTIGTITNIGGTFTYWDDLYTNTPQRYFRTVPQ